MIVLNFLLNLKEKFLLLKVLKYRRNAMIKLVTKALQGKPDHGSCSKAPATFFRNKKSSPKGTCKICILTGQLSSPSIVREPFSQKTIGMLVILSPEYFSLKVTLVSSSLNESLVPVR